MYLKSKRPKFYHGENMQKISRSRKSLLLVKLMSQSIKLDSYLLIEWFQLDEKNYEVVTIVIMMLQFNVIDGQNLII